MEYRECIWVDTILKVPDVKIPQSLRVSMENMAQQMSLLKKIEAKMVMAEIMQP